MKRPLSIFLLSIFLFAQFGKVISYVYCKWEARTELQCDCDKILTHDDHQGGDQLAKLNSNPKWEEPLISDSREILFTQMKEFVCHIEANRHNIAKGFAGLPFHPPAEV